ARPEPRQEARRHRIARRPGDRGWRPSGGGQCPPGRLRAGDAPPLSGPGAEADPSPDGGGAPSGPRGGSTMTLTRPCRDRAEAGRVLAERLAEYAHRDDVIVLALPRGGVPVAFEVARALGAPLDVFLVRKLGVPGHEELAMGAIATGDVRLLNE